jgi:hypothetical protein
MSLIWNTGRSVRKVLNEGLSETKDQEQVILKVPTKYPIPPNLALNEGASEGINAFAGRTASDDGTSEGESDGTSEGPSDGSDGNTGRNVRRYKMKVCQRQKTFSAVM